jgi:hypothetical protein
LRPGEFASHCDGKQSGDDWSPEPGATNFFPRTGTSVWNWVCAATIHYWAPLISAGCGTKLNGDMPPEQAAQSLLSADSTELINLSKSTHFSV